jgi:hypothetical protein
VPLGAAEVEEREVCFFFLEGVGVFAERERGVRMAELARDPWDALARGEGEACDRMASHARSCSPA